MFRRTEGERRATLLELIPSPPLYPASSPSTAIAYHHHYCSRRETEIQGKKDTAASPPSQKELTADLVLLVVKRVAPAISLVNISEPIIHHIDICQQQIISDKAILDFLHQVNNTVFRSCMAPTTTSVVSS
nr:hypothetical protein Itr_chr05CG17810 [Ipomoea trifida]